MSKYDATAYEAAETRDKQEKRGLWADASPQAPRDFRRNGSEPKPAVLKAPGVKPTAIGGQVIGNRNSLIFHLPNRPDYNKVSERNHVPFESEAAAQAAGYRKARNFFWRWSIHRRQRQFQRGGDALRQQDDQLRQSHLVGDDHNFRRLGVLHLFGGGVGQKFLRQRTRS